MIKSFFKKCGDEGPKGDDGITPHIGKNGNWFIGEKDTGISATGPRGQRGFRGERGPEGAKGEKGDNGPPVNIVNLSINEEGHLIAEIVKE